MKVLAFDIWGDYAHFRKYFTTSSPLTYAVPPKTAVYGMISAVLGIDKNKYLEKFSKAQCDIAISIVNPIKKSRIPMNYIDTKSSIDMSKIKNRTQVNLEVLKDVKYRIYVAHRDEKLYRDLKESLENNKSVYTLSLGLSEFIANYKYVGEYEVQKNESDAIQEINSVVPYSQKNNMEFKEGREYLKDTVYNEMDADRVVTEYIEIVYERNGKSVSIDAPGYSLESGDVIAFI